MISESSIMAKLNQYASSSAGKKKMKDCIQTARDTGTRLASGAAVPGRKEMCQMAEMLIGIIRDRLPESIAAVGDTLTYSQPKKLADGSYEIQISFDESALFRPSLDTGGETNYDGIKNIVALFNNGYSAKDYLYGWWENHHPTGEAFGRSSPGDNFAWVRSRKDREALLFMQAAEDEFNIMYGAEYNVTVHLGSDYTE